MGTSIGFFEIAVGAGMALILVGVGFRVLLTRFRDILQIQMNDSLSRPVNDLNHRIQQLGSELKENLSDRFSKTALEIQERQERGQALSRHELRDHLQKSTLALETRFQSLEQQVSQRLQVIGQSVEAKLNENLKEGFRHFEKVQQHLVAAEQKLAALNVVGESISDLNQLLKLPHLRGGFGEATLERLLADFLPAGGYYLQHCIVPNSLERVDAAIQLVTHLLPIDSKFPRESVLPLFETGDPALLEQARRALSDTMRTQAKSIAEKYIRPEHGTTDMALLFLPSETLYFEVVRNGKLFEDLAKLKVFPVSPNTLAISLKAVSVAHQYYSMAKGVEKTIDDVQKARKHFYNFEKKFEDVGKGLKKAQEAFDTAETHLGRYESSVLRLVGDALEAADAIASSDPAQPNLLEPRPPSITN